MFYNRIAWGSARARHASGEVSMHRKLLTSLLNTRQQRTSVYLFVVRIDPEISVGLF